MALAITDSHIYVSNAGGKTLEWPKIATFEVTILDQATKSKINLTSKQGHEILKRIELVEAP